jgi:hypothetical protein
MSELSTEILEKASVIAKLAENTDPEVVAQLLAPWMREDPESFAQVTLALAQMADKDKWLKAGHSAYVRGERGQAVEDLERTYQQRRKARIREYARQTEQAELNVDLNVEVAA